MLKTATKRHRKNPAQRARSRQSSSRGTEALTTWLSTMFSSLQKNHPCLDTHNSSSSHRCRFPFLSLQRPSVCVLSDFRSFPPTLMLQFTASYDLFLMGFICCRPACLPAMVRAWPECHFLLSPMPLLQCGCLALSATLLVLSPVLHLVADCSAGAG